MKYLVYICNFFENNNIKYNGSFIYNYNGWNITYNDYKGHYITDKLVDRNVEKTYDSVKDINNSVKRIINYIDNSEYTNTYYLNWGVKFKNKKYIISVEIYPNKKIIELKTIRSLNMGVDKRSTFIIIDNKKL
jgi:hypothetical protein